LFTAAGLLIWAADFLFIHIFAAVACARGFADLTVLGAGIVPLASFVASVLALVATGAIIAMGVRRAREGDPSNGAFVGSLAAIAALLALIAIVFTGLPGLLLKTCGF
jgi:uncharacterized membrane protein YhaH (DUF805 family)